MGGHGSGYSFPRTNTHKRWVRTMVTFSLTVLSPEIQNQGAGRPVLFLQALGRILCVSSWLLAAPGIPWLAAAPPSLLLIFRLLLCGSLSSPLLTTTLVVRVRAHPNSGQPLLQTLLTKSTQAPLPNKVTITGTRGWEIDIFPSWRKYSSTKFRGLTMLPPC